MILYKYLGPARIDVIRDARIRHTQPLLFNDPFESKPYVAGMPPKDLMEKVSKVEAKRQGMSEEMRVAILKSSENPDQFAKVMEIMLAMFGSAVGVLSLTEKPTNLLMWAHYAAEHAGYVIGFDTDHDYWRYGPVKEALSRDNLRKVDYSEQRPKAEHAGAISLEEVYYRKSLEWEYEQEWRTNLPLHFADHVIEVENGFPICLFNFPRESVCQVLIGCRASEQTEKQITEIVRGTKEYSNVELARASIDPQEFKLNFTTI
jgi:hypothetical protein